MLAHTKSCQIHRNIQHFIYSNSTTHSKEKSNLDWLEVLLCGPAGPRNLLFHVRLDFRLCSVEVKSCRLKFKASYALNFSSITIVLFAILIVRHLIL